MAISRDLESINIDLESIFIRLFDYNSIYKIIICKNHHYAIRLEALDFHLSRLHKGEIAAKTRSKLIEFCSNKLKGNKPIYPIEPIEPIESLIIIDPAYQCSWLINGQSPCLYIQRDLRNLIGHCSKEHSKEGWINNRKRGIKSPILPSNIIKIRAQSFYPSREGSRLFRVIDNSLDQQRESIEDREEQSIGEALFSIASSKLDLRSRAIEDPNREQRAAILAENEPNPWLERTEWPKVLENLNLNQILSFIAPPDLILEPELSLLIKVLKGLIYRAYREARPERIGLASLEYINRKEIGEKSNERPLNPYLQPITIDRYSFNWARILLYLYRAEKQSDFTERTAYFFTAKQTLSFYQLQSALEDHIRYILSLYIKYRVFRLTSI